MTDSDIKLSRADTITIPATAVFEDQGPLSGQRNSPATWSYKVQDGGLPHAAIVTTAPAILRPDQPCADVPVTMLTGHLWTETSVTVKANHLFTLADVLDYPVPPTRPVVEIGKLIDDISVRAILLTDVSAVRVMDVPPSDEATKAAACLDGAKSLAASVGGGLGRQTSMVVFIGNVAAHEASFGCALGTRGPDLTVSWDGSARPPRATSDLIAKAGSHLTGAPPDELRTETAACVAEALTPDADELANREVRGVRIECQAFARDGGGGTVTLYRRFGAGPAHPVLNLGDKAALDRASATVLAEDQAKAADSLRLAKWFLDPAIPKEVKTFAMMAARVRSLEERCPDASKHDAEITGWAQQVGVDQADLVPGGRYFALMAEMAAAMRESAEKEPVEAACEAARRYD